MELMNKELEDAFTKIYPFGSQDSKGMDATVVVKYFNPAGAGTWLITEGEKQENGDWLLFGYCHIIVWEWGYVSLKEIQKIDNLPFGLRIERDLYLPDGASVKDLSWEDQ